MMTYKKINILLVEPNFPKPSKSKNHNNFMPIGLLKLAAYHWKRGDAICLVHGEIEDNNIFFEYPNGVISKNKIPDRILITSYFTYWAKYVRTSVKHYKKLFSNTKVVVGGIYASLMPDHCKSFTGCDEVFQGIHEEAEKCEPAYNYLEKYYGSFDYQIIHSTRGCIRNCEYCGVSILEPKFQFKSSINSEIVKPNLIFYDNNLLANPHIESILTELAFLKEHGKIKSCEAQSGLDGRLLENNIELAFLLKKSGFKNIRISWDGALEDAPHILKQLKILKKVGFDLQEDLFIFMIYNWDIPFEILEEKRIKCWEWKVQIVDCRYRPLNQTYDKYSGQKFRCGQTNRDYHIHKQAGWTDEKIRIFRKHVRRQNICVRLNIQFYSNTIERKSLNKNYSRKLVQIARHFRNEDILPILKSLKIPFWFPEAYNGRFYELHMKKDSIYEEFEKNTNLSAIIKNKESNNFKKWRISHIRKTFDEIKIDFKK